ncbi:hypothetical protein ACFLQN_03190 [Candidatus Aenigmatarchaeota archaeon]
MGSRRRLNYNHTSRKHSHSFPRGPIELYEKRVFWVSGDGHTSRVVRELLQRQEEIYRQQGSRIRYKKGVLCQRVKVTGRMACKLSPIPTAYTEAQLTRKVDGL